MSFSNTMDYQRRLLPSLSMLAAFDAAARTGSFTAAAKKLNLTQGAISRQISKLEDQLEVVLFHRSHQNIELTEIGKNYAREIQKALQTISTASLSAMTNPLGGVLNLAVLPTFGTRWLMPRLPSFLEANPDITVNFVSRLSPFDFANEELHAAIHYGLPDWPKAINTFLMDEEVVPVCSPDFYQRYSLDTPGDLVEVPLLRISTRPNDWGNWFALHNIEFLENPGMQFEQFSQVAKAATAGLGAALLPKFLIKSELKSKELVQVFDQPVKSTFGYYLVIPKERSEYTPANTFRDWLLCEVNR